MKRYIYILILTLIVGITACSPVLKTPEEHGLGETLEQAVKTIEAEAATDVDAVEISPLSEDTDLLPPEILSSETTSTQEVAPEKKISLSALEQDTAQEQDTTQEQRIESIPTMPIIAEAHQGFTYRPGQVVTVLAEGFEEGDTLAVTLVHAEQGQIDTHFVSPVSQRGNIPIFLPLEIGEAGTYPDGAYTLRVSGSDGTRKTYTFSLDFLNPAHTAPFGGCGVYPQPVLDSVVFVWCTGYTPSAAPLDIRGVVNGEELFSDVVNTLYSDGVALYVLDIFDDDPTGEWTLEMGQDVFTINVTGGNHE